jgi:hypothetical protein
LADRKFLGSSTEHSWQTVKDIHRDKRGTETGTTERQIQVSHNINYYEVTYRCKDKNCPGERSKKIRSRERFFNDALGVFLLCIVLLYSVVDSNRNKTVNAIQDDNRNQNNIVEPLSPQSNINQSKPKELSNKKSLKEDENSTKTSPSQTNSENITSNDNSNNVQVISKKIVITEETPEYIRRGLAIEMLNRGKEIDEIADSTYLTKREIRKLRRNTDKK